MKNITFLWYLSQFCLEREMSQTKVVQKIKTHISCTITIFESRAVYEIMWNNRIEQGRPQTTIRCIRILCWTTKATNTLSEYVTFIAFPLHQYLHERTSMIRYAYIARVVNKRNNCTFICLVFYATLHLFDQLT